MKNIRLLIALIVTISLVQISCKKEKDIVDAKVHAKFTYILNVDNQSGRNYDLYIKVVNNKKGFIKHGTIRNGEKSAIKDMIANEHYILGKVAVGGNVHDVVNELSFSHGNGDIDYDHKIIN